MTTDDLYEYFGTWTDASYELRIALSTFRNWRINGYIPYSTQTMIEKKTNGALVADEAHGKPRKKIGTRE